MQSIRITFHWVLRFFSSAHPLHRARGELSGANVLSYIHAFKRPMRFARFTTHDVLTQGPKSTRPRGSAAGREVARGHPSGLHAVGLSDGELTQDNFNSKEKR